MNTHAMPVDIDTKRFDWSRIEMDQCAHFAIPTPQGEWLTPPVEIGSALIGMNTFLLMDPSSLRRSNIIDGFVKRMEL